MRGAMHLLAAAGIIRHGLAYGQTQVVLDSSPEHKTAVKNVAVIGAGAAGASTAYHLAQYAQNFSLPINITVYERNPYIGGRSTTVDAYDDPYMPVELGASIFVELNQIMVDTLRKTNLSTSAFAASLAEPSGARLAIWNGIEFVFTQDSDSSSWWDIAKLIYKYGLAPIRTLRLMRSTVGKFLSMYDEPIFPFSSLSQVVHDVGLLPVTAATGEQYLRENSIGAKFAQDVVQASTRVNYAQNLAHIHGLETMVCMAAEGAMAVEGGNWQIFQYMLAASNANVLLGTEVTEVKSHEDGTFTLQSAGVDTLAESSHTSSFDAVVLAAPYQFANLTLSPDLKHIPDEIPYVQLHVTLFTSPHRLSPAFFNQQADKPAPVVILTTLPPNEQPPSGAAGVGSPGFFSISLLDPVRNPNTGSLEFLYKIFSPTPPNSTFFSELLGVTPTSDGNIHDNDITWIYRKIWNSYPYEFPRVTFEEIELDQNFWYTSGIESFISTMETSALMGKNVARLVADRLRGKSEFEERKVGMMQTAGLSP